MNSCNQIEEHLVDYLDEALAPPLREELEQHLSGCEVCRETVRSSRAISAAYRGIPESDVSSELAGRVIAGGYEDPTVERRLRTIPLFLAAAAVFLVMFIGYGLVKTVSEALADPVADRLEEGDEHREAGELEGALLAYSEAEVLAGNDERAPVILHRLADTLVALGKYELAGERLDTLAERYPDYEQRKTVLVLRGELFVRTGELDQAARTYQAVALEFPADALEMESRLREVEMAALGYAEDDLSTLEGLGYVGE